MGAALVTARGCGRRDVASRAGGGRDAKSMGDGRRCGDSLRKQGPADDGRRAMIRCGTLEPSNGMRRDRAAITMATNSTFSDHEPESSAHDEVVVAQLYVVI